MKFTFQILFSFFGVCLWVFCIPLVVELLPDVFWELVGKYELEYYVTLFIEKSWMIVIAAVMTYIGYAWDKEVKSVQKKANEVDYSELERVKNKSYQEGASSLTEEEKEILRLASKKGQKFPIILNE